MKKIKVGVIGVGHLGRFHALNYSQLPVADLIGVADLDQNKAEAVAKECGCRTYQNIESLLKEVDAVSIAVPTDQHYNVGIHALESGVHCLIEKPISRDLKEADGLIQAAAKQGLVLQIGHIERFNPAMQVLSREFLFPQFIEAHRLAPFNPRGTEVAVVLDLMIHDIDIVLDLVKSPVKNLDASGVAVVSDTTDIANARIRFQNGCVANLTASRISQKKMRKMRIFQKDAYIGVDFLQKVTEIYWLEKEKSDADMVVGEIGVGEKKRMVLYRRPEVPETQGLQQELSCFLQSIHGESNSGVSGRDGREALSIAIQILERIQQDLKKVD